MQPRAHSYRLVQTREWWQASRISTTGRLVLLTVREIFSLLTGSARFLALLRPLKSFSRPRVTKIHRYNKLLQRDALHDFDQQYLPHAKGSPHVGFPRTRRRFCPDLFSPIPILALPSLAHRSLFRPYSAFKSVRNAFKGRTVLLPLALEISQYCDTFEMLERLIRVVLLTLLVSTNRVCPLGCPTQESLFLGAELRLERRKASTRLKQ